MSKQPTIEQQKVELLLAGWTRISERLWRSPDREYFNGPHGAWLAMKVIESHAGGATQTGGVE